jgi:DNA-binding response OmpR family regulator
MPKKVLLVDDSATMLMMEEMILKQRTNYECVTAKDGLDAISRAVVEAPDLVLMDVVMPRMNGFEACKRMRMETSLSGMPIILVTSRGEEEYVETGFQSGCTDYITKPINGSELVTLLQSYLGQ